MEAAEALCWADSRAVVGVLAALSADSVAVDLVTLTVLSIATCWAVSVKE